jgi:hypothetical protein
MAEGGPAFHYFAPLLDRTGMVCASCEVDELFTVLTGAIGLSVLRPESCRTHKRRGASIEDPKKRFNSSLEGNARRAIDLHEGEKIAEAAFKQLTRAAASAPSRSSFRRCATPPISRAR